MHANSDIWWIAPLILVILRLLSSEASLFHAQVKRGSVIFRAGLGMRLLIGGGIIGFSALIITHLGDKDQWALAGIAVFVVLFCIVWPGTITITDFGVEQYIWWRRTVRIPWTEVTAIERSPDNDYFVYGVKGQKISFDRFHVDGFRFEQEVQSRAKLDRVIDSTAPPTLKP